MNDTGLCLHRHTCTKVRAAQRLFNRYVGDKGSVQGCASLQAPQVSPPWQGAQAAQRPPSRPSF